MSKPNAFKLAILTAVILAGGLLTLSAAWGESDEYRTVVISGWIEGTPYGDWETTAAREIPNVARVLNQLCDEGWRIDRIVYVGESLLVVAAR